MKRMNVTRKGFIQLLLAGTIMFGFASCKKDKSVDGPGPSPASARIKEYKNGDEFARFTYNADGTIQAAAISSELNTGGVEMLFTVSYNAQKKISLVKKSNGDKIVPVYENGVLSRADVYEGDAIDRSAYTSYHYEANLLKRATIYLNTGTDFIPLMEFQFTYDGAGNLTQSLLMMANGQPGTMVRAGHVNFQHDQKTNPLYIHRDFMALLWQGVSKSNITREDHFDASQQLEDVFTYAYTYKANGLPEKATVTEGLPGQPPVTSQLTFTYE